MTTGHKHGPTVLRSLYVHRHTNFFTTSSAHLFFFKVFKISPNKVTSSAHITGPFSTRTSRFPRIFRTKHAKGRFVCMCGISLWYTDRKRNEGSQSQLHFSVTLIFIMQNVSALTTCNFIVCGCKLTLHTIFLNAWRWLLVKAGTCCVIYVQSLLSITVIHHSISLVKTEIIRHTNNAGPSADHSE